MLWFWGNQELTGEIVDADGDWVRDADLERRERARLNWFLGAEPDGGFLEAIDLGPDLAGHLENDPVLFIEMALHPYSGADTEGTLLWMGTFGGDLVWKLSVINGALVVESPQKDQPQTLHRIPMDSPFHLNLQLTENSLIGWLNGEEIFTKEVNLLPQFPDPWDAMVTFGGAPEEEKAWDGAMEYLAMRHANFDPGKNYDAWRSAFSARTPPQKTTLTAQLVSAAREPSPADLSEYGEGILAMHWKITESSSDEFSTGEELLTWSWYFMDQMILEDGRPPKTGEKREITISPWDVNPQLQGIQQIDTDLDPEHLILLPQYFLSDFQPLN